MTDRCDILRRLYAALNARDIDALLETLSPAITFEPVLGVLYRRHVYRGHDGIRQWFEEISGAWDSYEGTVDEARDNGEEVLALVTLVARRGEQRLEAQIGAECKFDGERIASFVGRDAGDVADRLGLAPRPPAA